MRCGGSVGAPMAQQATASPACPGKVPYKAMWASWATSQKNQSTAYRLPPTTHTPRLLAGHVCTSRYTSALGLGTWDSLHSALWTFRKSPLPGPCLVHTRARAHTHSHARLIQRALTLLTTRAHTNTANTRYNYYLLSCLLYLHRLH